MARPQAIMPVKQDEYFIKMALFGPPGVGKSALAGSGGKRTLLLLHDNDEASSVAQLGMRAEKWVVPTFDELEKAYEYCRHDGIREFDWFWWDNTTLMQELFMDDLMIEVHARKPNQNRFVPDKPQYQQVQNQLAVMMRNFKALPVHFGWTAHVMSATDMDDRIIHIPMIQGGQGDLSQKFCGYGNVVAYMQAVNNNEGKVVRKIHVTQRGKVMAKSRWAGLQGVMVNPTIPKIEEAIRSKFPMLGHPPEATTARKVSPAKATKAVKAAKKAVKVTKATKASKATKATKATKKIGAR